MKIKKVLAMMLVTLLVLALFGTTTLAFASAAIKNGRPELLPGNTQSNDPAYSMAWLDNVVIRDDASAIVTARIVPKAAYPYSRTYDEFIEEVDRYAEINSLNETTVGNAYDEVARMLYYTVVALGMTENLPSMCAYLTDYGITLPQTLTPEDNAKVAIVYAAIKYNAIYVLYQKNVTLPRGITLDQAELAIMAELSGVFLPSGVDTMNGFAVQAMRTHVEEFDQIPISDNPSNAEVFHWAKVLTAAANDYQVPLTPYAEATGAQKDYVDYAYYASVFNTVYDVTISPARLAVADASADPHAVHRVILTSMLEQKDVMYNANDDLHKLFDLACRNGCFDLDEEFFSDVFNYDLYVRADCEKLWFTPFPLASQLGGDDKLLALDLGGTAMKPSSTAYYPLDLSKTTEKLELISIYNNGGADAARTVYTFNIIKTGDASLALSGKTDLVAELQGFVDNIVPAGDEKTNAVINSVINAGQAQAGDLVSYADGNLTTYVAGGNVPGLTNSQGEPVTGSASGSDGHDFTYLDQLIGATYPDSETAVADQPQEAPAAQSEGDASVIARSVAAIKENPQIIAAPTGILALGGLVGYFWNKKRKDALVTEEEPEEKKEFPDLSD